MKTAAIVVFLCLFAAFSIALKTELRHESNPVGTLKAGEPMPDFELMDTNNKPVKFSEVMRDKKAVAVNFWAPWCGPCRVEMPSFEKLYNEQKDHGFIILAITEDDDRAKLDKYLKEKPVSFPVLIDKDGALAKKFKIGALPTTVLVGTGGKITQATVGVEPYFEYAVRGALSDEPKKK